MARIVFRLSPVVSHHKASFSLAHQLRTSGHKIIYASYSGLEKMILSQKFEFYSLDNNSLINMERASIARKRSKKNLRKVFYKRQDNYYKLLTQKDYYQALLNDLQPDLVFLGSNHSFLAVDIAATGTKVATIETQLSLSKRRYVPPLFSKTLFNPSLQGAFFSELQWLTYFAKRQARHVLSSVFRKKPSYYFLLEKVALDRNYPIDHINHKRCFYPRLLTVPELILPPQSLDVGEGTSEKNSFYIRHSPHLIDDTLEIDLSYTKFIDEYTTGNHTFSRMVYCSLGTLGSFHSHQILGYFQKLVRAFKEKTKFLFVVSIGTAIQSHQLVPLPKNIRVFQKVNQIKTLHYADLAILHGGINSIVECVLEEVPMIIYPLSGKSDQNGNSARVVFHRIGTRGDIQKDDTEAILRTINFALNHLDQYKKNIRLLKSMILEDKKRPKGSDLVEDILLGRL